MKKINKTARKTNGNAEQLNNIAVAHHQAGRLADATRYYEAALAADPANFDALHLLGLASYHAGSPQRAVDLIRQAIRINSSDAAAYNNLGIALDALNQRNEAIACYRKALELKPDYPDAWNNLGAALKESGQLDDAISSLRRALQLQPAYNDALLNLGAAFRVKGALPEALDCYRAILAHTPRHADAHFRAGIILGRQKQYDAALGHLAQALELDSGNPEYCFQLAYHLDESGRRNEALPFYRKAIQLKPDYFEAHYNLGLLVYRLGGVRESIPHFQAALTHNPALAEAYFNLGIVMFELQENDVAAACYRQAIALKPDYVDAYNNLGRILKWQGHLDEAIDAYRTALTLRTDFDVYSNLLQTMLYSPKHTADELYAEFVRCGELFETPLAPLRRPHTNTPDPDKRLRIGYVSADFRRHSVAFFIEPVLANHDKSRVEVTCYYNLPKQDDYTERFKAIADRWRQCDAMTDDELAECIRRDEIDILVDLSGHTAHNRLLAFARKPAPVQATWIGIPATTGFRAIDYRLTEEYLDPTGAAERHHTETLVRLPVAAPYNPPAESPPVNELPALASGCVTFGCLNNPAKINPAVVALWSRIMAALPGSRLMLGNMNGSDVRKRILQMFEAAGIPGERLVLVPQLPLSDYLALHHRIDIALDPFPFNGGTTTTHSLWMGVPVVTLEGDRGVARVGCALLRSAGLSEFVAGNEQAYYDLAVRLAGDLQALNSTRQALRQRFAASLKDDASDITRHIENAFRAMWQRWCAQQDGADSRGV